MFKIFQTQDAQMIKLRSIFARMRRGRGNNLRKKEEFVTNCFVSVEIPVI